MFTKQFKKHFANTTRRRGQVYSDQGHVEEVALEGDLVTAEVFGEIVYYVEFRLPDAAGEDQPLEGKCDCIAFERFGPCKHLWALLLELEMLGLDEEWMPGSRARVTGGWRERVRRVHLAGPQEERNSWREAEGGEFRLEYRLETADLVDGENIIVRPVMRSRRQDGEWGAPKPFEDPAFNGGPQLTQEDERALELLRLSAMEGWESGYMHRSAIHAKVPPVLFFELMPLLCSTGRLLYCRSVEAYSDDWQALKWGGAQAWTFEPSIQARTDGGTVAFGGSFARNDEVLQTDQVDRIFVSGLMVVGETLVPFQPVSMGRMIQEQKRLGPIEVPTEEEPELRKTLELVGMPEMNPGQEPRTIIPHIHMHSTKRYDSRLNCIISFVYGPGQSVAPGTPGAVLAASKDADPVVRDFAFEVRALKDFLALGGRKEASHIRTEEQGTVAPSRFPGLVAGLLDLGWIVEADGVRHRTAGAMSVSVASGIDWFELQGGMSFDGEMVSLPELLEAARAGQAAIRLGDGSLGVLPNDWLKSWGLLELGGKAQGESLRFPSNQGWLLDALLEARKESVQVDKGFERYRKRLAGFSGIKPGRAPRTFRGELRDYQADGVGWFAFLRKMGLGGCLADDMGLGKTIQVLSLLESRRTGQGKLEGGHRPSLVVVPRSLVFNWVDEAARFTPKLRVFDYTGVGRAKSLELAGKVDMLVTTYGTLRRDAAALSEMEFDYVVLDEASAIKNAQSQASKACRLLRARHRLALSGTPIENHLGELWSLMEFLNPGMLGHMAAFKRFQKGQGEGQDLADLSKALRPFLLRRTKDEVLTELPVKSEQVLYCDLGTKERKRYDELRNHFRQSLLGGSEGPLGRMKIQVLEALLRLRQCACHPALLDKSLSNEDSAKLAELLPRLEELVEEGHKVLVFSQFTSLLAVVRERLDRIGLVYEYLDGRTRKRKEKVERFQSDPSCPLFLISLKAGGHGLNLTAADYIFLLDPWWNPAIESQAVDRAHRMGQSRPVHAYRLIARDTVEEKVLELQGKKRELAASILGQGKSVLGDLTRTELEVLLS
ncbi:MAG: helicase SNF2 [bacterium]|nr:helicase SNF2 [bacterium]